MDGCLKIVRIKKMKTEKEKDPLDKFIVDKVEPKGIIKLGIQNKKLKEENSDLRSVIRDYEEVYKSLRKKLLKILKSI